MFLNSLTYLQLVLGKHLGGVGRAVHWQRISIRFNYLCQRSILLVSRFISSNVSKGSFLTIAYNTATNQFKGRLSLLQAEKLANSITSAENRQRCCVEARTYFLAALSINPIHCQSFRYLSHVYRLESNPKMAEKMLRDAVAIDPLQVNSFGECGE